MDEAAAHLVEVIREVRPQVLVTYDAERRLRPPRPHPGPPGRDARPRNSPPSPASARPRHPHTIARSTGTGCRARSAEEGFARLREAGAEFPGRRRTSTTCRAWSTTREITAAIDGARTPRARRPRCAPTPARSPWTARSSPSPTTWASRSSPPSTTSWCGARPARRAGERESDLFAGCRHSAATRPGGGLARQWQRDERPQRLRARGGWPAETGRGQHPRRTRRRIAAYAGWPVLGAWSVAGALVQGGLVPRRSAARAARRGAASSTAAARHRYPARRRRPGRGLAGRRHPAEQGRPEGDCAFSARDRAASLPAGRHGGGCDLCHHVAVAATGRSDPADLGSERARRRCTRPATLNWPCPDRSGSLAPPVVGCCPAQASMVVRAPGRPSLRHRGTDTVEYSKNGRRSQPGEPALSRETDSSSSGPQGRGGAAYPSGTPPYGTRQYPSLHPSRTPPEETGAEPEPQPDEPRTETTLTTRIRINIPGSRPIPPVVMRTPMSERTPARAPGGTAGPAERRRHMPRPAAAPAPTRHRRAEAAEEQPPADKPTSDWFAPRKPSPRARGPVRSGRRYGSGMGAAVGLSAGMAAGAAAVSGAVTPPPAAPGGGSLSDPRPERAVPVRRHGCGATSEPSGRRTAPPPGPSLRPAPVPARGRTVRPRGPTASRPAPPPRRSACVPPARQAPAVPTTGPVYRRLVAGHPARRPARPAPRTPRPERAGAGPPAVRRHRRTDPAAARARAAAPGGHVSGDTLTSGIPVVPPEQRTPFPGSGPMADPLSRPGAPGPHGPDDDFSAPDFPGPVGSGQGAPRVPARSLPPVRNRPRPPRRAARS